MLLALYVACTVVPIGIVVSAVIAAILRGSAQSLLCMECEQCLAVCPLLRKGRKGFIGPKAIMTAARSGRWRAAVEAGALRCTSCGLCVRACPRGLSPCREVEEWRRQAQRTGIGPFAPDARLGVSRSPAAAASHTVTAIERAEGANATSEHRAAGTAACCGATVSRKHTIHEGMEQSLDHNGEAS